MTTLSRMNISTQSVPDNFVANRVPMSPQVDLAVRTRFPLWPRSRLETMARDRAEMLDLVHDRGFREYVDTDRLVVNMLRHEFSDYDDDQSQAAHRVVCEAVESRRIATTD
jgi:hypothetical protein